MSTRVGRLRRVTIRALGDDYEAEVWQWLVVFAVAVLIAFVVANTSAHELLWRRDWVVNKPRPLPMELDKDFALVGESAFSPVAIDPVTYQKEGEGEGKARFWRKASVRSEHFLNIVEPTRGRQSLGLQFLAKNPEEVQPITWEEFITPFDAGWQGQFFPVDAIVNREAWVLDVEYRLHLSLISYAILVVGGILVVYLVLRIYGSWVRPVHVRMAEALERW